MNDNDSPEDLELTFVPPGEREAVRNFDEEAEAELAAGFLRAQGIAAEVGAMMIPGLQSGLALWVYKDAAQEARTLLDEVDANARRPQALD
ncbi:MAG: hypothetical protein ACRD1C_04185 [Terriglobales bacterium]